MVLPDGRCDLILRFNAEGDLPLDPISILIVGPSTSFHIAKLKPGLCFIGARLRPGFLWHVLKINPSSLCNKAVIGEDAIKLQPALRNLVAPACTVSELIDRLVQFVVQAAPKSKPNLVQLLIDTMHVSGGRLSVKELSLMHGVKSRTVHRLVVQETGLSPKMLNIILQFHRALRLLRDHQLKPVEAAFEAGYSDQAHMTRSFQKLGGFTPARLPDVVLVTLPMNV